MYKRRNYFVKKRFQINFSARFVLLLILESVLMGALFMYVSGNTITTGYRNAALKIDSTPSFFMASFALITAIAVVGIGLAGMVVFILLSHRIAGPLYRFEKVLAQIESGDLTTRIDLRKTDQLMELKGALNVFVNSLDKRMGRIKVIMEEAKMLMAGKDDPQTLARLRSVIDLLKDEIEHFKVSPKPKE